MINFLAEISHSPDNSIQATPSEHSRNKNIYYLDIRQHPEKTYWTDWNGVYDNFTATQIELYFSRFLRRVNAINELDTDYTFFLDSDYFVYFNIPLHPWLYPDYAVKAFHVEMYLAYALNPDRPSYNNLRGSNIQTLLKTPSINVKLSDNISGIVLNQSFSIELTNSDGYFDDENIWNLFNTPIYIKKSIVENPKYEDFKTIRYGLVENTSTTTNSFIIEASDRLRAMEEPVCDLILKNNFPIDFIIDEKILNKNIPIVYGKKRIKPQKLNDNAYIIAEHITQIHNIYNSDNEDLNNIEYILEGGVLIIIDNPNDEKIDSVIITGYVKNRLGEIILDIIKRKSNIPDDNSNWQKTELEQYINISPLVNIAIDGGNVKNAIQNLLKNDMAFLIQRADGRLTIRRYGENYKTNEIKSWTMTKEPDKKYENAQSNYFSSCKINYNFENEIFLTFLYNERENEAENIYRKRVLKTFDTDLIQESRVIELAKLLADRYLIMRQTITLLTGTDTSSFELLDTVTTEIKINDRLFSNVKKFFIKELNIAQDILVIEEIKGGL